MTDAKLDFWIKNNINVLFVGKHGVGKTARILDAFKRNNLKWKYFSASTLDPWVDFVGVPKEVKDTNGTSYLDLIRPKCFAEDNVEAIFMDEYNRSPAKVRNATMELLQFRSINGKKFNNLRFIWAAINPEPEEGEEEAALAYDVERIDPAQKDRFEVTVNIPYKPDVAFFRRVYGDEGKVAVDWWAELQKNEKDLVSPRRLDYALKMYKAGGDLRDVLSAKINVAKLLSELKNGSYKDRIEKLLKSSPPDTDALRVFLKDENSFTSCVGLIITNPTYLAIAFDLFPEEKQYAIAAKNEGVQNFLFASYDKYTTLITKLATSNKSISRRNDAYVKNRLKSATGSINKFTFKKPYSVVASPVKSVIPCTDLMSLIKSYKFFITRGTNYRIKLYDSVCKFIADHPNYAYKPTELEAILGVLDGIASSTQDHLDMFSFDGFKDTLGWTVQRLGAQNTYPKLDKYGVKLREFISKNQEAYS